MTHLKPIAYHYKIDNHGILTSVKMSISLSFLSPNIKCHDLASINPLI